MYDFSVIMPVYNGEKFLKQAIDSVILQELNLELIIVNDCSSDDSDKIIKEYIKSTEHIDIKYISLEKNMGVSYCRNLAIKMAKSDYIAFLDCDDIWEKGKLKAQLKVMQSQKPPLCCTAREFIDFNGNKTGKTVKVNEKISYESLLKHNSIALSSSVVKSEIAKEILMGNDKLHEDYIFWLNILKKYGYAVGINETFLLYRLSENSKSSNKINSAKMHYNSLIAHGVNPVKALYLFCFYAVNGVLKHKF